MHKIGALLLLILLIIVLIFSIVWEDKKPDTTLIPIEDTTEIFMKKNLKGQEDQRFKLKKQKDDLPKVDISFPEKKTASFTLINTKGEDHKVTITNQKVIFHQNEKPIVLVNLFATWCPPCIGEIAYLNDLQKKYQKELFIAGILTHDSIDKPLLETFMAKQEINYFISHAPHNNTFSGLLASTLHLPENFSIPLTVIYVNGEYFTHYEGTVPVEMIEYDIQQAKKQLNPR